MKGVGAWDKRRDHIKLQVRQRVGCGYEVEVDEHRAAQIKLRSSEGRGRDGEDQADPGKRRGVVVARLDTCDPVDGCGSGYGEEVEVRVIREACGGGEGVGDGVTVAGEDEVVDGVGAGGQGESEG